MIVVDSSVWIASLRRQSTEAVRLLQTFVRPQDIIVGDIILLEVLQGTRDDLHAARVELILRRFRVEAMLDPSIAIAAARHYRNLRRAGITVSKLPDLVIATYCLRHGHELLHDDRDYIAIARELGLRVVTG